MKHKRKSAAALSRPVARQSTPSVRTWHFLRVAITSDVSRSIFARIGQATFYLLLLYAALLTLPVAYSPGAPGLDPSWVFATNYFPHSSFKYGPDIIFTFGPLGFIYIPENIQENLPIALIVRGCVWLLLLGMVIMLYRRAAFPGYLVVASLLLGQPLLNMMDYMVGITGLLLVLSSDPEEYSFIKHALPLGLLAAVALLTKHSTYVLLMLSLTVYFVLTYIQDRRRPSRASVLAYGFIVLIPFISYLIYNASLRGLWLYLVGIMDIQTGYSDAMSTLGLPLKDYFTISLLIGLVFGITMFGTWRKWVRPSCSFCIITAFFIGLKHGVVRADGHIVFTYAFTLILFAIFIMNWSRERIPTVTACVAWVAISIVSLIGMSPLWTVFSMQRWDPTPRINQAKYLLQWTGSMAVLSAQTQANLQTDRLAESFLGRIGQSPITIFPSELSYGQANGLNLLPLYALQTYATYTHRLDRLTAERLLTKTPADARLLMEWNAIDGRHPLLDVPSTWMAIYRGYEAELADTNQLLLKKRQNPRVIEFKPVTQGKADLREWQYVPNRRHAVSTSISMSPTLWGIVRRTLYKTNPISIEFETDRGMVARFRAVPDVLREPFIVNCLPLDAASLEFLLFEHTCQQRVTRFRFLGEGLESFSATGLVAFAEAPDEHLEFMEDSISRYESILRDTGAVASAPAWTGSVDAVNGAPALTSAGAPLRLTPGQRLEIQGWAASNEKTGEAFESVYAILGNQRFRALVGLRPDVAKFYKNPRLGKGGFTFNIDTSMIRKGTYAIMLVGVTQGHVIYRCPGEIYVVVP